MENRAREVDFPRAGLGSSKVKRLQDFQVKHQPKPNDYDNNGGQHNESAKDAPLPAFKRHPNFCSSTKWSTGNRLDAADAKIDEGTASGIMAKGLLNRKPIGLLKWLRWINPSTPIVHH